MKTKLVIFGITGDLSTRKLLPALSTIVSNDTELDIALIGVSRRQVDVPSLIQSATGNNTLASATTIVTMDLTKEDEYKDLKETLDLHADEQALIYLSVPPSAAADIVDFVGRAGLNTPNVKILFEKPFGFDLESAKEFIERTGRYFTEDQLYRIDHYMAKEIAQEIVQLRHDATTRHHYWSAEAIASVDIVASEKIDIEGRVQFYEQTGALRDFIQGHLMQLLSLILLNPKTDASLAKKRLAALQSIVPVQVEEGIRAQYEGYGYEVGNEATQTETFVSIQLHSNDPLWESTRLSLTTGKALSEKRSYIRIAYRDGTEDVFEELPVTQPGSGKLDAYERVLLEAIQGSKAIFTTSDEVVRSWEILDALQKAWQLDNEPLKKYKKGASLADVLAA